MSKPKLTSVSVEMYPEGMRFYPMRQQYTAGGFPDFRFKPVRAFGYEFDLTHEGKLTVSYLRKALSIRYPEAGGDGEPAVYLVIGDSRNYGDGIHWTVAAYNNRAQAEEHVAKAATWLAETQTAAQSPYDHTGLYAFNRREVEYSVEEVGINNIVPG